MKLIRLYILAIVLAILASSCSTNKVPEVRQPEIANDPDEIFVQMEEKVAGFGGMFFDENNVLNVYLRSEGLSAQAAETKKASIKEAAKALFGDSFLTRGNRDSAELSSLAQESDIKLLSGQYTATELVSFKHSSSNVLNLAGVVYTDFDEASNRVRVAVEKGTTRAQLEQALAKQGVPSEAVIISETEAIQPVHTLQQRVRPVAGGLQLNWDNNNNFADGSFVCTLGFNAVRAGVSGFVTNSHCSGLQGGVQGIPYYQHVFAAGNLIGTEIADPLYFAGAPCPAGRICRRSDAAFASYAPGVPFSLGHIYRTVNRVGPFLGPGSINICHLSPTAHCTLQIVGEQPFPVVGLELAKIGRTTGWTWGTVSATCVNANVAGTIITQLCQDIVNGAGVAGGDSGSPVFRRVTPSQVHLYGLLWGGNAAGNMFVFSRMRNIQAELGALNTPF